MLGTVGNMRKQEHELQLPDPYDGTAKMPHSRQRKGPPAGREWTVEWTAGREWTVAARFPRGRWFLPSGGHGRTHRERSNVSVRGRKREFQGNRGDNRMHNGWRKA